MLTKAPWSNQRVSTPVRIGAWFFVFCGALSLLIADHTGISPVAKPSPETDTTSNPSLLLSLSVKSRGTLQWRRRLGATPRSQSRVDSYSLGSARFVGSREVLFIISSRIPWLIET